MLIAVAAITFIACTEQETPKPINNEELVTLKFNIRNVDDAPLTKALLGTEDGKNFLNWEDGDKIGTFSIGSFTSGSSTYTESKNNAGNVEVSGNDYTLNVQSFYAGTVTTIYSYFPYSSGAGKDKTSAVVTIPETQHMTELGFDADAMPMAGTPVTVDLTTAANTDTPCGTINFSNLGSIIKFRVYTSESTSETLTSVTYKATGIGGAFSIDLTGIDVTDETTLIITPSETVNELTTSIVGTPAISDLDHAIDVYMVVAPGTYSGSQVVVTTNAHTYTLDASGAKTFTRSHVKPIKVDISKGTPGSLPTPETWSKVTSASDFTPGTYYILRADGEYYVPNASGNPTCATYSAGDPITNAMKWTATASGLGLQFESVANAGYYLWTTNTGSANTISVAQTSTGANASKIWTFATVNANETIYYTATAGADKYLVSYGTSNWRYYGTSNINGNNIPAEFYKLDVVDNRTAVTLSFAESTINKTTANYDGFIGQTASAEPNETAITDNITYAIAGDAIGDVDPSTGDVTLNGTEGDATVTASFAGDQTFKPASASYTISVTEPLNRYIKATSIVSGEKYLIVGVKSGSTYLATPIPSSKTYAYPAGYNVTSKVVDANTIEINGESEYLFTLTTSGTGYTIKQPDNRYIYASGSYATLNVGTTQGVWTFVKQSNDSYKITETATGDNTYIQFGQGDYTTFGRYSSDQTNASLPFLYVMDDGKSDAGISYTPASATVTFGETLTQPTLSNEHGLTVTYASDATGVATVESNGAISVVGAGTAKITASWTEQVINSVTYRAGSTSFNLTVSKATPTIAAFNNPTTSVAVGSKVTNTTTISNGLTITYSSNNTSAATVDAATGEVTGVANGTAVISASFAGNENYNAAESATYTITVGTGGTGFTPVSFSWTQSATTSGYSFTMENGASKSGYIQDKNSTTGLDLLLKKSDSSALFTTQPTSISITVKVGGGSTKDPLTNNVLAYLVDSNGDNIAATETVVTTKVEAQTGTEYTVTMPLVSTAYGLRIHHEKESSYNIRIYSISFTAN